MEPLWKAFKYAFGQIAMFIGQAFNEISPILLWVMDKLGVQFKKILDNLGKNFSWAINLIISIFTTLLVKIGDVVGGIGNSFNRMVGFAKSAWSGIKSVFSTVGTFFANTFSNAWTRVKNVFSVGGKIFDGIKDGIASAFKSIVNKLISGINRVVAIPFNAINTMLNKIRSTSVLGIEPFKYFWGYNPVSVPKIPQLARGGFVDGGGLFQAGEFGKAEMIGNYGGKTTVMPLENTDFVSAMYDAIYNATTDAMSQNSGSDSGTQIIMRMNEYELGRASISGIKKVRRVDGMVDI